MKTVIRNIGQLVSGDIRAPRLDADSILIESGRIAAVGSGLDEQADVVIDARGTTVMPGLIDGTITVGRSHNTPPAARAAEVVKGSGPSPGGH